MAVIDLAGAIVSGGTTSDPLYNDVVLNVMFDRAQGVQSITDYSKFPRTYTGAGAAAVTYAGAQTWDGCAVFASAGDWFRSAANIPAELDLSTTDFVLEARAYRAAGVTTTILSLRNDGVGNAGLLLYIGASGTVNLVLDSTTYTSATAPVPTSAWFDVQIVRSGSSWTVYVNATSVLTLTRTSYTYTSTYPISIGASNDGGGQFNGRIAGVRITKNLARTPAALTSPFPKFQTPTLTTGIKLAGSTAGAVAVAGSLTAAIRLAGSTASSTTVSGTLTSGAALAGNASGSTAVAGALTANIRLAGGTAVVATAAASLSTGVGLAGSVAATAAASGVLTTAIRLNGNVPVSVQATATLLSAAAGAALSGTVVCAVSLNGELLTPSFTGGPYMLVEAESMVALVPTDGTRMTVS